MQLIKIDPFELQPFQTLLDALSQIFGPAVWNPLVRPRPRVPAFRRDHEPFRIRMERLRD